MTYVCANVAVFVDLPLQENRAKICVEHVAYYINEHCQKSVLVNHSKGGQRSHSVQGLD